MDEAAIASSPWHGSSRPDLARRAEWHGYARILVIPPRRWSPTGGRWVFFEPGWLDVEICWREPFCADVRLTGFRPCLPERGDPELRARAAVAPFDLLDFWAIDFEHVEIALFRHHWQSYRTRNNQAWLLEAIVVARMSVSQRAVAVKAVDVLLGMETVALVRLGPLEACSPPHEPPGTWRRVPCRTCPG